MVVAKTTVSDCSPTSSLIPATHRESFGLASELQFPSCAQRHAPPMFPRLRRTAPAAHSICLHRCGRYQLHLSMPVAVPQDHSWSPQALTPVSNRFLHRVCVIV